MGKCEVFNKGRCFGCIGLDPQYDIDKIKKQCETYKEEMNEGEQLKWNDSRWINKF